jgi:uncharacterized protein YeaO (DUF488 family)
VRKEDYSKLDYYDVWMPELAPSVKLVSWALSKPFISKRWSLFERRYRQEMRQPTPRRIITLLAAPYHQRRISPWAATVKTRRGVIAPLYDSSFLSMGRS